jgi:hypothetical protein
MLYLVSAKPQTLRRITDIITIGPYNMLKQDAGLNNLSESWRNHVGGVGDEGRSSWFIAMSDYRVWKYILL